jgi:hypothetical protein
MPVRGRMVSATLGASRRFSRLASNDHRLLYVLLIPHADAEGRLDADARILGGKAFTLLDVTPSEIEAALLDMHAVGLIELYEVAGERYLEIVDFHAHQVIRRKKDGLPLHEAPSRIPPNERSGSVGHQTTVVPQGNHGGTTVEPQGNHGGTTVAPRWFHGGPTETSAHQSKAIQSNKKGFPPLGGNPLPTVEPALSHHGAAAASGDAENDELKNVDLQTGEIRETPNLPRVVLAYSERKRRERGNAPPALTWTPAPKPPADEDAPF